MRQEQSRALNNETWRGFCLGQAEAAWRKCVGLFCFCFFFFFFFFFFSSVRFPVAMSQLLELL